MSDYSWAEQADNVVREFKLLFAETLIAWQQVELVSYLFYASLMRPANPRMVSATWHTILSFDAKIGLTHNCIFFFSDQTIKDQWQAIKPRLEKSSRNRNSIVHGVFGIEMKKSVATPTIHQSFVDATALSKNRVGSDRKLRKDFIYDRAKLVAMKSEFGRLASDIRDLIASLKSS